MAKKTNKKVTKKELTDFTKQFRSLNQEIRTSFRMMDGIIEDLRRVK
ncbi:MAG: hypothetical protein ABIB47_05460 [Candidatus Woesearchaeota archaeon]